jgi:hypothetical protein
MMDKQFINPEKIEKFVAKQKVSMFFIPKNERISIAKTFFILYIKDKVYICK